MAAPVMHALCTKGASLIIHGYLEFSWENSILYVEAFGPFNEEGFIEASNEYLNQISKKKNSNYSIIEIWDAESLSSPEVFEKVAETWTKDNADTYKRIK